MCYNIRSLRRVDRRQTLANFLLVNDYDIICICETWLTEVVSENELFLQQYHCFYANRKVPTKSTARSTPTTTAHGGIMICIANNINAEQLCFNYVVDGSVTVCALTLVNKKYYCAAIYLLQIANTAMTLNSWENSSIT